MEERHTRAAAAGLSRDLVHGVLADYSATPPVDAGLQAGRALFDFEICVAGARQAGVPELGRGAPGLALAAHALDRDDLHWGSLTHPGAIIWAVVLDAGAETDLSGADAVRAAIVGYEITARLGQALGAAHRRYWHATTTAGTVGAATSAAIALGLDEESVANAIGHAASVTGGSIQSILERSDTRLFHRAHAASTGLAAARAARAGLAATRFGFESEHGLFAATAPGSLPEESIAVPLRWAIEELWVRIHPASGFAHTALEAAVELGPIERARVRRVDVVAPAASLALAGIPSPADRAEGWWSIPYVVAVGLIAGNSEPLEGESLLEVSDLISLTELAEGADDLAATVVVCMDDDSERSATCERPLGHPARPLGDDELIAKWRALRIGSDREAEDLLELVCHLDELSVRDYLANRPASIRRSA